MMTKFCFATPVVLRFPIERIEQHLTEPRNPVIAKVFRLLGWADCSGEGIEKIAKGWTSMVYDKPVFQDDKTVNMFEVIFPLAKKGKNADQVPCKYRSSTIQVKCPPILRESSFFKRNN